MTFASSAAHALLPAGRPGVGPPDVRARQGRPARLGVPVETVASPSSDELGYRIDRRAYELPDVDLDRRGGGRARARGPADRREGTSAGAGQARGPRARPGRLDAGAGARPASTLAVRPGRRGRRRVSRHTPSVHLPDRAGDAAPSAPSTPTRSSSAGAPGTSSAATTTGTRCAPSGSTASRADAQPAGEPGAFDAPGRPRPRRGGRRPGVGRRSTSSWRSPPTRGGRSSSRGGVDDGDDPRRVAVLRVDGVDPVRDRSWLLGLGDEVVVLAPRTCGTEASRRCAATRRGGRVSAPTTSPGC
jgi:proteasome accessory factor B